MQAVMLEAAIEMYERKRLMDITTKNNLIGRGLSEAKRKNYLTLLNKIKKYFPR